MFSKLSFLMFFCVSLFAADSAPLITVDGTNASVVIVIDLTAEITAAKQRVLDLPVGQRPAARQVEKDLIERIILNRVQDICAKAERSIGISDAQIDSQLIKITTNATTEANQIKTFRPLGGVDLTK